MNPEREKILDELDLWVRIESAVNFDGLVTLEALKRKLAECRYREPAGILEEQIEYKPLVPKAQNEREG